MELEKIKKFLRVTHSEEDELIDNLAATAEKLIIQNTGKNTKQEADGTSKVITEDEIFRVGVMQLTAHWYENRGIISDKSINTIPVSVDYIMSHIMLDGEYIWT